MVAVLLHARGLLDPPVEAQVVTVAQERTQEVTLLPDTLADPCDGIGIIIITSSSFYHHHDITHLMAFSTFWKRMGTRSVLL